jgi:hypothetical protein
MPPRSAAGSKVSHRRDRKHGTAIGPRIGEHDDACHKAAAEYEAAAEVLQALE